MTYRSAFYTGSARRAVEYDCGSRYMTIHYLCISSEIKWEVCFKNFPRHLTFRQVKGYERWHFPPSEWMLLSTASVLD